MADLVAESMDSPDEDFALTFAILRNSVSHLLSLWVLLQGFRVHGRVPGTCLTLSSFREWKAGTTHAARTPGALRAAFLISVMASVKTQARSPTGLA